MSNISVNTITDASGGSTASINGLTPQASNMQPHNLIINGAMTVDQRNAGAAVTGVGTFPVDRFQFVPHTGGGGAARAQQVLDGPDGFLYSTKLTVTTAGSGDLYLVQNIEANNLLSVGYGTPTAKQTTLSFWVKSSIAGIQSVFLYRPEVTRAVTLSYTINQSDTWEYKTIVIPSDTTGVNTRTNTTAVTLHWFVSSSSTATENTAWKAVDGQRAVTGQVALASTLNATWQITGVQLEEGSSGSSFAHENVADTLQKCLRYYQKTYDYGTAVGASTELGWAWYGTDYDVGITSTFQSQGIRFETTMRNPPTMVSYDALGNSGKCTRYRVGGGPSNNNGASIDLITTKSFRHFGQGTAGTGNIAFHYTADAEL